jgi:hypothetical protein
MSVAYHLPRSLRQCGAGNERQFHPELNLDWPLVWQGYELHQWHYRQFPWKDEDLKCLEAPKGRNVLPT